MGESGVILQLLLILPVSATCENADDPWRIAWRLPSPVFLQLVVRGSDTTTGRRDYKPNHCVKGTIREDPAANVRTPLKAGLSGEHVRNESIGNAVAERDKR